IGITSCFSQVHIQVTSKTSTKDLVGDHYREIIIIGHFKVNGVLNTYLALYRIWHIYKIDLGSRNISYLWQFIFRWITTFPVTKIFLGQFFYFRSLNITNYYQKSILRNKECAVIVLHILKRNSLSIFYGSKFAVRVIIPIGKGRAYSARYCANIFFI